jgi:hypothetical protein
MRLFLTLALFAGFVAGDARASVAAEKQGSDNPDLRGVFTETCQMYRHYVLMRYYALAAGIALSVAIITVWVANLDKLQPESAKPLAVGAIAVLFLTALLDYRLASIGHHLARSCDKQAATLQQRTEEPPRVSSKTEPSIDSFLDANHHDWINVWMPSVLIAIVCLVGSAGWAVTLYKYHQKKKAEKTRTATNWPWHTKP